MIKQLLFIAISILIGYTTASSQPKYIQAEKKGSGYPMILIHGMACSADVWNEFIDRYRDDFELHVVTLPGFGNKEPFEAEQILETIKNDLIHYIESENITKPHLVGHSMGGFLSLWAASERSDLFGKIISVDGVPYFPVLAMPGMTPESAKPFVEQMKTNMQNQTADQAKAAQEVMIAGMISSEAHRPAVVEMGMNSNPEVIGQALGEMYTTDLRDQIHQITNPVLVFGAWYAYKDYGATKEFTRLGYEAQLKTIPNLQFALADTAYHFVFYDEPEWFYQVVDEFLAEK